MSGREFVDTNVLIYAFDKTAGAKGEAAVAMLERLWSSHTGCVSLQVLQEFYVTATKKLTMPAANARAQVERLGTWTVHRAEVADVVAAIDMSRGRQVSFWDGLIIRSAQQLGCSILWSEDMGDGQSWDGLVVKNPFVR